MSNNDINLIGIDTQFINKDGDDFVRKHTQEIPQWHLDNLANERKRVEAKEKGTLCE